ncbi:MFS transporter [Intrasporangium sp. YIM S08009]|uniref:MFS transporter n=1 Tax=Intrasporangium zincisolvens TaxID=3080018 RepID=UPI002B0576B1|nr:MFS transporter [Intrasporangium sp. YIM S08009]
MTTDEGVRHSDAAGVSEASGIAGVPVVPVDRAALQRKVVRTLVGSQVLGGVGMACGIAVGALIAEDLSGTEALAGVGTTSQVLGTALLTIPVARATAARGRRVGLRLGLSVAFVGAALVLVAAVLRSFPLFVVGMFLFGGGTTANNQTRYAAADLAEPARRGRDLSIVVWATTIGSVAGPNLVGPGKAVAHALGLPELAGVFTFSLVGFVLAWLVVDRLLLPDPLLTARRLDAEARIADAESRRVDAAASGATGATGVDGGEAAAAGAAATADPAAASVADVPNHDGSMRRGLAVVRANPRALLGMLVMALGHLVMVSVMVMTPIHMKHGHAELEVIGFVISIHILGMFALSPLVGMAVDRWGSQWVATVGGAVLMVAAVLASWTQAGWSGLLLAALFLLGVGWSCTLVSGSTLLTAAVSTDERPATQGLADVVMGLAGATGGVAAGIVVGSLGYGALASGSAVVGVVILVLGAASVVRTGGPAPASA